MKKLYFLFAVALIFVSGSAQIINFPDANFKSKLLSATTTNGVAMNSANQNVVIDTNADGNIQLSEALLIYKLYVNNASISDLTGLSNFTNLKYLNCNNNQLTLLNTFGLGNLTALYANYNQLSYLNLSNVPNLTALSGTNNQFTTLDVNSLVSLQAFDFANNLLTSLFMKNGLLQVSFFSGNPGLLYVCCDDVELSDIQSKIATYGYTNCQINTYCTFSPGGTHYAIQGNNHYDSNGNGCDASDIAYPNLKLSFFNGTNTTDLIADATGAYQYDVVAGTYTVTPVLENPSYFNISPTSATISFPAVSSPFLQDFCIEPNGVHNDLDVVIIPTNAARPAFNAAYRITYSNKGNLPQSGTINFTFDDSKMDLSTANPATSGQSANNLTWTFSNLQPFETRDILLTMNINSNAHGGDVMNYTATITGAASDETPEDNTITLNQTLVNSFDPNDKTCLEGATITPQMVGKFVHYVIRFENTGFLNIQ